ncbi:MAG: hypothetical protein JKY65_06035 [Planctomycetes bacterium]|nr:hypothetical protein [Planctomycetota bacterium]
MITKVEILLPCMREGPCPPSHVCQGRGNVPLTVTWSPCAFCAGSESSLPDCPLASELDHANDCPLCTAGEVLCPGCDGEGQQVHVTLHVAAPTSTLGPSGLFVKALGSVQLRIGTGCNVACTYCYVNGLQLSHRKDLSRAPLPFRVSVYLQELGVLARPLRFGEYHDEFPLKPFLERLERQAKRYLPGTQVYASTLDPFQSHVQPRVLAALKPLFRAGLFVTLTTKLYPGKIADGLRELISENSAYARQLRLGPSIGCDDAMARTIEPMAASVEARLRVLDLAAELGARPIVNFAPLHPLIPNQPGALADLMTRCLERAGSPGEGEIDLFCEAINPRPDLLPVAQRYAFASAKEQDPAKRERLADAARQCVRLYEDPAARAELTAAAYAEFDAACDASGAPRGSAHFWPAHEVIGALAEDPRCGPEFCDKPRVMTPLSTYATRVPGPAEGEDPKAHTQRRRNGLDQHLPALRAALPNGPVALRNAAMACVRSTSMSTKELAALVERATLRKHALPLAARPPGGKLTVDQKAEARRLLGLGLLSAAVAETLGVEEYQVRGIKAWLSRSAKAP